MTDLPDFMLEEFVQACHDVATHGLVSCSSGNLSRRLDEKRMVATASRSWLGRMTSDNISLCRISDGAPLDGSTPTVEIGFHAGILRCRSDVDVVLHFQTPFATALACQEREDINYFVIPEIPFYVGRVATLPYLPPGTEDLADAVSAAMRDHDMAVMGNHGLVTVAGDYAHAIQNAVFFELACRVIVLGDGDHRPIPTEETDKLLALREEGKGGA